MSVRLKLVSIVLFVALLPVSISAYTMLRVHSQALSATLAQLHQKSAELGAARSSSYLEHAKDALGGLIRERIDWGALTQEERSQVLWLIYEQLEGIAVVSLMDAEGNGLGSSAYRAPLSTAEVLAGRTVMTNEMLADFGASLPHAAALEEGRAIGVPLPPATAGEGALVPLAFSVIGSQDRPWVVAVGLSLSPVCKSLESNEQSTTRLRLLRESGDSLCGLAQESPLPAELITALQARAASTLRYNDTTGTDILAATAPAGAGWHVVATQVASTAFEPRHRIRQQVVFWIGLGVLGALVAGLFLAQGITGPIKALSHATREVAAGKYDCELPVEGRDEFAQLSEAFNAMSTEVRSWNQELVARVDERTRALTEAQGQLLESKKLAAVASMSAGIAHEINNPLTAVISFAQVLQARAERDPAQSQQAEVLRSLGESALRIHDIVKRMQRLSEVEAQGMRDVSPGAIVRAAASTCSADLKAAEATLEISEDAAVDSVFVNVSQLEHAIGQLLTNAISALDGPEKRIAVRVRSMGDDLVQIDVTDTGRGIPSQSLEKIFEPFYTRKEQWSGQGLGLAEAKQLITNNHGTLRVQSTVGEGTTMSILLPKATERSHLV